MHGRRGDTPHRERRAPGPVRWRTGTHNVRGVCCGRAGPTSRPGARRFTRQPLAPLSRRTHTITNKRPASSQPAWRHMPPRPQQQQDLSPARPDQQAPLLGARTRPSSDTTRLLRAPSFAAVPCPTYRACHTHAPTRAYTMALRAVSSRAADAAGSLVRSSGRADIPIRALRCRRLCSRTRHATDLSLLSSLHSHLSLLSLAPERPPLRELRPLGACRAPQRPP